jgi:hypothetical protein
VESEVSEGRAREGVRTLPETQNTQTAGSGGNDQHNDGSEPAAESPPVIDARSPDGDRPGVDRLDNLYARAVGVLAAGHISAARRMFESVVRTDPHYAPAHFRIGEIMLLNRNAAGASQQFALALSDRQRLAPRDQSMATIGSAVASQDLQLARRLVKDFEREHPDDPELRTLRRAMGEEAREERGQEPRRGAGRRHRRPQ